MKQQIIYTKDEFDCACQWHGIVHGTTITRTYEEYKEEAQRQEATKPIEEKTLPIGETGYTNSPKPLEVGDVVSWSDKLYLILDFSKGDFIQCKDKNDKSWWKYASDLTLATPEQTAKYFTLEIENQPVRLYDYDKKTWLWTLGQTSYYHCGGLALSLIKHYNLPVCKVEHVRDIIPPVADSSEKGD